MGASAYRSGERLHNEYDGITHDYTNKSGILHTEILLPENAPREYSDRANLWNAVEKAERGINARTAREIEIALPRELSADEQIKLTREYVNNNFINRGMCADISIHSGHKHRRDQEHEEAKHDKEIYQNNPHAHILLTTRPLDENGFVKSKTPFREYNEKQYVHLWREEWANAQNREFERMGLETRVSHKSNADRGLENEPTIHMGHKNTALERRGIRTERGNQNRAIEERNRQRYEELQRRQKEREQEREQNRNRIVTHDLSR
ncbi:MAG: MobA/MobL family protein [Oscillospiraceae bacterium]|nr:MobA/MobL family protein [Oscillospiraceae bacterium]